MSESLPAEAMSSLKAYAESGNENAKQVLSGLGEPAAPAKEADGKDTEKGETAPNAQEPDAKPAEGATDEADQDRGRNGGGERKPTKLDTIRELRRKRRELEALLDTREQDFQKKLSELEGRLNTLQNGNKPPETDEDELTRLLAKPREYMSNREKILLAQVEKMFEERLQKLPDLLGKQQERSQASEVLKSIHGFDLEKDEDELLEKLEEYGIEEKDAFELAENRPLKFAKLVQKVWADKVKLPPAVMAAKKAAASGSVSSGKPAIGSKPSLKELNDLFAKATLSGNKEEAARLYKEIESMASA